MVLFKLSTNTLPQWSKHILLRCGFSAIPWFPANIHKPGQRQKPETRSEKFPLHTKRFFADSTPLHSPHIETSSRVWKHISQIPPQTMDGHCGKRVVRSYKNQIYFIFLWKIHNALNVHCGDINILGVAGDTAVAGISSWKKFVR